MSLFDWVIDFGIAVSFLVFSGWQNCDIWSVLLQNDYILICGIGRVFWMLLCVLNLDGSWFGTQQVLFLSFSYCCSWVFLSISVINDQDSNKWCWCSYFWWIQCACGCFLIVSYLCCWSILITMHGIDKFIHLMVFFMFLADMM